MQRDLSVIDVNNNIEYSNPLEDDIIRNSHDIEKSTRVLKENDSKGPLVMGFDPLPWGVNSAMRTASA